MEFSQEAVLNGKVNLNKHLKHDFGYVNVLESCFFTFYAKEGKIEKFKKYYNLIYGEFSKEDKEAIKRMEIFSKIKYEILEKTIREILKSLKKK